MERKQGPPDPRGLALRAIQDHKLPTRAPGRWGVTPPHTLWVTQPFQTPGSSILSCSGAYMATAEYRELALPELESWVAQGDVSSSSRAAGYQAGTERFLL